MNNFEKNYELIFKELQKIGINNNFYFKPIKPKLFDFELLGDKVYFSAEDNRTCLTL